MGLIRRLSRLFSSSKVKMRIICVGLDNSGKSTIINHLKLKKVRTSWICSLHHAQRERSCSDDSVIHLDWSSQ